MKVTHRLQFTRYAPLSVLLLQFACSGMEDPSTSGETIGSAGSFGGDESDASPEDADEPLPLAPRLGVRGVFPQAAEIERIASQVPGRNLAENPPKVDDVHFIPATSIGADAHLEVEFAEAMPTRLDFFVEGVTRTLRDDGLDGDRIAGDGVHTARVPSDFEQAMRGDRANDLLAGESDAPRLLANTIPHAPYSLVITDLNAINDPARVSDPCTSYVTPSIATKEWSFGYLMTHMANQSLTGKTPAAFARAWLDAWRNAVTINGDPVSPPRIQPPDFRANLPENISVPEYILRTWTLASRRRSDGTLDPNTNPPLKMEKAPFRLLAIVNRPDLRKNSFFGEGSAGELRFVFGVLDSDPNVSPWGQPCRPLDTPTSHGDFRNTTVILEYAVDKASHSAVVDWAAAWRNLTLYGPAENAGYRDDLQLLTDSVVRAGVGAVKNRANGSALIRLRTNESVDSTNWHLREFAIDNSTRFLTPRTVKQTPAARFNGSSLLRQYINNNASAIIAETNVVPNSYGGQAFLGGRAINQSGGVFWNAPGITNPDARHKFSMNTCNGCHSVDTGTFFAHIMSREWDEEAPLSGFLTGAGDGQPLQVSDPVTGQIRFFNEFERRVNDMATLLYGPSFAALSFQPTSRTD